MLCEGAVCRCSTSHPEARAVSVGPNNGESVTSSVLTSNSKGVDGREIVDYKVLLVARGKKGEGRRGEKGKGEGRRGEKGGERGRGRKGEGGGKGKGGGR